MPDQTRTVAPGKSQKTVRTEDGKELTPPADWELLPPGDAGLTRRVKAAGPTWTVQQKKGRKVFSLGVWAPAAHIQQCREQLEKERANESYGKRRESDARRREKVQGEYVTSFRDSVLQFLDFAECHSELAQRFADAVTEHATPVGSGTVARTSRIPIEQRAESAVIAWMRHQTTAYDRMIIPRIKGKRRETRRMLADQSRRLLVKYRSGEAISRDECPLQQAFNRDGATS